MLEEIIHNQFKVDVYNKYSPYLVAVDCIIFGFMDGELKLLIINRKFEPAKGKWSLMGGFVGPDESMDEAAYRVLYELTGLQDIKMVQLYTHGDVNRDPGARVISTSYYTLIKMQDIDPAHSAENGARWCPINELPELIFDHMKMVEMALHSLSDEAHRKPIGFDLLPEKFTLPQLQSLYESICQEQLDKRNFRKQILDTGLLIKLDEKDKDSSKKGAFYYRFDHKKYQKLVGEGFLFKLKGKKEPLIRNLQEPL